jgi:opacity protein-like surface antigen
MKKLLLCLAVAMTAATASAAEGKPSMGLGARVNTDQAFISVPVNVSPGLRIEPFVGIFYNRNTDSTGLNDVITSNTQVDVGISALVLKELGENVELLAGGKLELGFIKDSVHLDATGATNSDSSTLFGIAAVGGAEYYLSPRFALGVEAELGLKTAKYTPAVDVRDTTVYTATFVTAKVFFK